MIDRIAAQCDGRVAAHGGVALIVDEQHCEVGARKIGLHRDHAIHVVVAARLEDQQLAQMVEVFAGVAALFQDRRTGDRRIAGQRRCGPVRHPYASRRSRLFRRKPWRCRV